MLPKVLCWLKQSAVGLGIMLGTAAGSTLAAYSLPTPAIYLGPIVIPSVYAAILIIAAGAVVGGAIFGAIGAMINLDMDPKDDNSHGHIDEIKAPTCQVSKHRMH